MAYLIAANTKVKIVGPYGIHTHSWDMPSLPAFLPRKGDLLSFPETDALVEVKHVAHVYHHGGCQILVYTRIV